MIENYFVALGNCLCVVLLSKMNLFGNKYSHLREKWQQIFPFKWKKWMFFRLGIRPNRILDYRWIIALDWPRFQLDHFSNWIQFFCSNLIIIFWIAELFFNSKSFVHSGTGNLYLAYLTNSSIQNTLHVFMDVNLLR